MLAEQTTPSPNMVELAAPRHLGYLDATRGIAAWMVALFHFVNWKYDDALPAKLSFFILNGRDAVSFFFVLSGLVLSYKYLQLQTPLNMRVFYTNRIVRLFPAYFIAVLANFLYAHRADLSLAALQEMFLKNTEGFWEEALLIRRHNIFFPPGWTMNMEFAASLLLPFAILLFKTNRKLIVWLAFFCVLTGNSVLNIMFLHFVMGLAIAGHFTQIRDKSFRQRKLYRYRYWIIAGAVLLFSLRQIHRMSPLGSTLIYVIEYLNFDFFFFSGIAAAIFLVWLISSDRLQRLMSGKLLLFFGRISYGIYLMHWLVGQYIIYDHWDYICRLLPNEPLRITVTLAVAVTATIILATILYYAVERPTIKWGKRLSQRWKVANA